MSELQQGEPGASASRVVANASARGLGSPRSRWLLALVVLLALAGFATWYWAIRDPGDLNRLQGDWQVSIAGRPTPTVIQVTGDRWQSVANGVAGKPYRITLNPAANPKQIDLDPIETTGLRGPLPKLHGIYAFTGSGTVHVRVNDTTEPRPETLDDPDAVVWQLTKVQFTPGPDAPPQPR